MAGDTAAADAQRIVRENGEIISLFN